MKSFLTFLLLLLTLCPAARGQEEYIIEEAPGSKMLHVSRLGVSEETTLEELLELFPELLAREGDTRLENYDLQVNGISTGVSAETVLIQLLARDIESITVSQSPSMTQQVKGQGAVINVTLKTPEEGFSGSAALQAGTLAYVMPAASFNYRKHNLTLRGSLMMEYYHPLRYASAESWELGGKTLYTSSDTSNYHYGYELARFQMDYKPDNMNVLKAWLWQSWSGDYNCTDSRTTAGPVRYRTDINESQSALSVSAGALYSHTFAHSSLTTQLEYSYSPQDMSYNSHVVPSITSLTYDNTTTRHSIGGFTGYTYNFTPSDSLDKCSLSVGLNYSMAPNTVLYEEPFREDRQTTLQSRINQFLLSPYIEASGDIGPVQLSGGLRYQHVMMTVKVEDEQQHSMPSPNGTAFLKLGWQIKPHHYLNLVLDRSVSRPDARQMYPYKYYDPSVSHYIKGNEELIPMTLHNASLNYIFDFSRSGHSLVTSAAVQYIRADDIICTTYSQEYISYINGGSSDILSANAMLHYGCGCLSLNLTGNLFQNWSHIQGTYGNWFNYNLNLVPVLTFKGDWRITPKLTYYSSVVTDYNRLSDYFYGQLGVSKTWGCWTVYAEWQDVFHKTAEDNCLEGDILHTKLYDLRSPNLLLGFVVAF